MLRTCRCVFEAASVLVEDSQPDCLVEGDDLKHEADQHRDIQEIIHERRNLLSGVSNEPVKLGCQKLL